MQFISQNELLIAVPPVIIDRCERAIGMADQYELPPAESFRRRPDVVRIIRRRVSGRERPIALAVSSQIESQSRVVRKAPEQRAPQYAMTGIAVNAEQRWFGASPNVKSQLWRARFEEACF